MIAYIFSALHEVTPLTLQKLLYYIQGNYAAIYDKPLFDALCEAWVHGPVYRNVYNLFRDFKYNPIDDDRFVPLKESALPLTPEAKEVVDRVLDTFGMYSGKVLESITHKEAPWLDARKGFLPDETSHAEISLDAMKSYFKRWMRSITSGRRMDCGNISLRCGDTTVDLYKKRIKATKYYKLATKALDFCKECGRITLGK